MAKRRNSIFNFIGLVFVTLFLMSFRTEGGGGDKGNGLSVNPSEVTEERLLFLIDSVLNLKNAPKGVVEDLQALIRAKHAMHTPPEALNDTVELVSHVHAAANNDDFSLFWNTEKVNPYPDSMVKADTGIIVRFYEVPYCFPFQGPMTSPYGFREKKMHKGVDIDLESGNPVKATFDGFVRVARRYGAYGNVVVIRHANGLETLYAHLSRIKVRAGDRVTAGQLLGLGGSTGRSTGSHLHFEIRYKGVPINPESFFSFEDYGIKNSEIRILHSKGGFVAYPANCKLHTVAKGETLTLIAKKNGITLKELKALNGITAKKAYAKVGQVIRIS